MSACTHIRWSPPHLTNREHGPVWSVREYLAMNEWTIVKCFEWTECGWKTNIWLWSIIYKTESDEATCETCAFIYIWNKMCLPWHSVRWKLFIFYCNPLLGLFNYSFIDQSYLQRCKSLLWFPGWASGLRMPQTHPGARWGLRTPSGLRHTP